MWVAVNGTALLLWRQVVWIEKRVRCVNILILKICHMNFSKESKTSYCQLNCKIRSKNISYLFTFIRVSTRRYTFRNEWTGVAMLCCHGKISSFGELIFSVMGTLHWNLQMLFIARLWRDVLWYSVVRLSVMVKIQKSRYNCYIIALFYHIWRQAISECMVTSIFNQTSILR